MNKEQLQTMKPTLIERYDTISNEEKDVYLISRIWIAHFEDGSEKYISEKVLTNKSIVSPEYLHEMQEKISVKMDENCSLYYINWDEKPKYSFR